MSDIDGYNADITDEQRAKLRDIFPEVFSEDKIDFERLRATLGDDVALGEKYGLNWKGKSGVFGKIQEKTVSTLHPQPEESVDWDSTQNMFIEGDNLEALKVLHKAYYGKIKMIYIDPPYNTGNDFIYDDTFAKARRAHKLEQGDIDEEGFVTRDDGLRVNNGGHKHSNWLDFMYPRLFLARNLLQKDGVIFVSINDIEVSNLRLMMNEIFGEENFVHTLKWKRKKQPSYRHGHVASVMEYVLVYARSIENLEKLSITSRSDLNSRVDNASNNISERIIGKGIRVKLPDDSGIISKGVYKIKTASIEYLDDIEYVNGRTINSGRVKARFRNNQEQVNSFVDNDLLFITKNTGFRRDLTEEEKERRKTISDLLVDWGDNQESDEEQSKLFPEGKVFSYPKPIQLIYNLAKSLLSDDEIILDFFAGSGTTAHAIEKLNASDGGSRRWITVQLPENLDENIKSADNNEKELIENAIQLLDSIDKPHRLTEITRIRLKRAKDQILSEHVNPEIERTKPLDLGFRSYVLGDSNFKKWNELVSDPDEIKQQTLDSLDPIENDTSDDDLLTEILLKRGISPLVDIEEHVEFVFVPSENLAISLACEMNEQLFSHMLAINPSHIILLDQAFKDDVNLKTNLILQAKKRNISVEIL